MLRCQCPSVCPSVCDGSAWHIIANLGFKFRSHFTAHCGRRAARRAPCGRIISRHASQCQALLFFSLTVFHNFHTGPGRKIFLNACHRVRHLARRSLLPRTITDGLAPSLRGGGAVGGLWVSGEKILSVMCTNMQLLTLNQHIITIFYPMCPFTLTKKFISWEGQWGQTSDWEAVPPLEPP